MTDILTVNDVNLERKRVFVRCDFNVPLDESGAISDDTRIEAALPTIRHLMESKARLILASHLGRPKGEPDPKFSLRPVAESLSRKLGIPVSFVSECVGPEAEGAANALEEGGVLLLENLRFNAGETKNDPGFSEGLAKLAEAYVNDAFGTAHRAHASTEGITRYLNPCVAGFLIERELAYLGEKVAQPEKPFTVILGGAKVSDKITVIDALLDKADSILIGGAMAYTFNLALGKKVGASLCEPDRVSLAEAALKKAEEKGVQFLLPLDNRITDKLDFDNGTVGEMKTVEGDIPDGWEGVDIGPKTIEAYQEAIQTARTILWNGPMGVFEIQDCATGTFAVAEAVASAEATSIIGGGDSVKAIKKSGVADQVTFMSTGGGASLEFLEGKVLPGVAALDTK